MENLQTENILYYHKISQLQREIEIYNSQIAENIAKIQETCRHQWIREYSCEPCTSTDYTCEKCGISKLHYLLK